METSASNLNHLIEKVSSLKSEIQKVIVGQDSIIEEMLIALMAGGHCLLEGVPGLAKTLMVRTMSQALDLSFRRIQFTPDLMPTDIIGTEILEEIPKLMRRKYSPTALSSSPSRTAPGP